MFPQKKKIGEPEYFSEAPEIKPEIALIANPEPQQPLMRSTNGIQLDTLSTRRIQFFVAGKRLVIDRTGVQTPFPSCQSV
jgi:hypothetical protein